MLVNMAEGTFNSVVSFGTLLQSACFLLVAYAVDRAYGPVVTVVVRTRTKQVGLVDAI